MASAFAPPSDDGLCAVCSHKHTDARLLVCLHSFCRDCVDQLSVTEDNGTVRCPLCQHVCDLPDKGAAGLPKDFTASQEETSPLTELECCSICTGGQSSTRPTLWCKKCHVALCVDHVSAHAITPVEGGHSIDLIQFGNSAEQPDCSVVSSIPMCPQHDQPLRFYCGACDVTICGDCTAVGDHAQHKPVKYVKDIVDQRKAKAAGKVEELTQVADERLETSLQAVNCVCSELKKRSQEVSLAIEEAGRRAVKAVETCVAELLQEVDDIAQGRLKLLEEQRDELKTQLRAARNAIQFSHRLLQKQNETFGVGLFPLLEVFETRVRSLLSTKIAEQPRCHSQLAFCPTDEAAVKENIRTSLGKLLPCHASAKNCKLIETGERLSPLSKKVEFTLQAKNADGQILREGGDVVTTKWIQNSSYSSYPHVGVKDNNNGTYTISFYLKATGTYKLEVWVNGGQIPDKFSITYRELVGQGFTYM